MDSQKISPFLPPLEHPKLQQRKERKDEIRQLYFPSTAQRGPRSLVLELLGVFAWDTLVFSVEDLNKKSNLEHKWEMLSM